MPDCGRPKREASAWGDRRPTASTTRPSGAFSPKATAYRPAGRLQADWCWLLCGYFLRIVSEKQPRDGKRREAHQSKLPRNATLPENIGQNRFSALALEVVVGAGFEPAKA